MSKRQKRVNTTKTIKASIPEILGKNVNIVLKNGRVFFGQIISLNENILVYKNMRLKAHETPLDAISEIIIDLEA